MDKVIGSIEYMSELHDRIIDCEIRLSDKASAYLYDLDHVKKRQSDARIAFNNEIKKYSTFLKELHYKK